MDEDSRRSIAVDYKELYSRQLETVPGRAKPVLILSEQEHRDIAYSLMIMTHRLRSLDEGRRLQQLMDDADRPVLGRMAIDIAGDIGGLDEITPCLLDELAHRLEQDGTPHRLLNAMALREAQSRLCFDRVTRQ